MSPDPVEMCRAALGKGDVLAFVGLADALAEQGHPDSAELCALAATIAASDDWSIVFVSMMIFFELVKGGDK